MPGERHEGTDRVQLRALRAQLEEARSVLREHPAWDSAHLSAQRRVERLERQVRDVQARRPESEWRHRLEALDPVEGNREQIAAHYPDAVTTMEVFDWRRRCRKCGGHATASWVPDRVRRICRRCTFSWFELPLDSVLLPEPSPEMEEAPAQSGD